jgi:hypothetical protein
MSAGGRPVVFVANPELAPPDDSVSYARPDDISDSGKSWRDVLLEYNETGGDNALGLCPGYQLYQNRIYAQLVDRFGLRKVYILSAGWGLIRADFLTPHYDITFKQGAERFKRRKKQDSTGISECCRMIWAKRSSFSAARTTFRCSAR